jgi:hypothetical protein
VLPDEQQATVAATWSLSVDLVDQLHPVGVARPLLEVAALLDPNGIPQTVFTTGSVTTGISSRRPAHEHGSTTEPQALG